MSPAPLLGIIGPFGPAQLACIRSWRCAGYRTAFFQTGGRRVPDGLQRLSDVYCFFPAGTALDDILDKVSEECVRLKVAGLAALSESLALKLHARQRSGAFAGTGLMLNTPDSIRRATRNARSRSRVQMEPLRP